MSIGFGRSSLRGARAALAAALFVVALAALLAGAPARAQGGGPCSPSPTALCLLDGRFRFEVEWEDYAGNPFHRPGTPASGQGRAEQLFDTPLVGAGYFWFVGSDDLELVVKAFDADFINGNVWLSVLPLTAVEYRVHVEDTLTGRQKTYVNPAGTFKMISDTTTFPVHPAASALRFSTRRRSTGHPAEALPSCDDPGVACVQGDRIAITLARPHEAPILFPLDPEVVLETATSAVLDGTTGFTAVEVVVKVLEDPRVPGRFWVLASSDRRIALTVTDLATGAATTYQPVGPFGVLAVADTDAFAPDPPSDRWMETQAIPGFRFQARITAGESVIPTRQEAACIPETLCVSGAVPGRSELFVRIVGPKPNGHLWPTVVKFSTSQIEIWIEQTATGQVNYYRLDPAAAGSEELPGFFDRGGFSPSGS